ncbi:MAG TPA: hypothetical protein VK151_01835 [Fluviicola sp.]|nr:hypothetical protein [Fluviicola sp.]
MTVNTKEQRLAELVLILWMALQSFYWISLFEPATMLLPLLLAFGLNFGLTVLHVWFFLSHSSIKRRWLLAAHGTVTIAFLVVVYLMVESCGCYVISWLDFLPNGLTLALLGIVGWRFVR